MIKVFNSKISFIYFIFIFSIFCLDFGFSQSLKENSIEITASQNLEWHQSENKILASGNAIVESKKFLINADKITGFYRDEIGNGNIQSLIAEGEAKFESPQTTIEANYIDYNFTKDLVIVKGNNILMTLNEGSIIAKEILTFNNKNKEITAEGNVFIKINSRGEINAQKVILNVHETGEINSVFASKDVKVFLDKLKQEIFSDTAKFDNKKFTIDFLGNVILKQGQNLLKGDKAFIDFNKEITRITSNEKNSVSGIIN